MPPHEEIDMKKILIAATAAAVALGAAGATSAQPWGNAYGYYDKREAKAYQRYQKEVRRYERERERAWRRGQYLPSSYRSNGYVLRDYGRYGLPAPAYGQSYYRYGNDVILGNSTNGLIAQVLAGVLGGSSYDNGYYGGYRYGSPYYR
jgi:Ni/Co efflux regulator RcnB